MTKQIDKLIVRSQTHKGFIDGTERDVVRLKQEISYKENDLKTLINHHADMQWCYEYLDALIKTESDRFINRLQETLNYGIKTIFNDRDYSIEIRIDDSKRASIHLCYTDENGEYLSPEIHNTGGGIRTVIGLLMEIMFLFHHKCANVMILDEALSMLSSNYLKNLFGLLEELSKSNHLKILLVTHDTRMTNFAIRQYVVENHNAKEIKKEVI